MSCHLDLLVPEWHGYGVNRGLSHGALALRDLLSPSISFATVEVPWDEDDEIVNGVLAYRSNLRVLENVRDCIESNDPATIFLIGGTCASEIGPVSFLNRKYQGNLTVLWFDAHADLNTPATSPSKHFHGMPLRVLLGDGPRDMRSLVFRHLDCSQVILAGSRDLDSAESEYVTENGIARLSAAAVAGGAALAAIRNAGSRNVYVHIDLDVLEPEDFPHLLIPTPGGVLFEDLVRVLQRIAAEFRIVGSSVVEYVPVGTGDAERVKRLVDAARPGVPSVSESANAMAEQSRQ